MDEDLEGLFREPHLLAKSDAMPAQVIGTGPTARFSAMPEMFESLMYAAQRELIISTPYYVPSESLQGALCTAARRGVDTKIIFPARNDSRIVGAASRSYYADLLSAGVEIHEYVGGLLHTKSLTLDAEVTLIGSANMDRRSFDPELREQHPVLRSRSHRRHAAAPAPATSPARPRHNQDGGFMVCHGAFGTTASPASDPCCEISSALERKSRLFPMWSEPCGALSTHI